MSALYVLNLFLRPRSSIKFQILRRYTSQQSAKQQAAASSPPPCEGKHPYPDPYTKRVTTNQPKSFAFSTKTLSEHYEFIPIVGVMGLVIILAVLSGFRAIMGNDVTIHRSAGPVYDRIDYTKKINRLWVVKQKIPPSMTEVRKLKKEFDPKNK